MKNRPPMVAVAIAIVLWAIRPAPVVLASSSASPTRRLLPDDMGSWDYYSNPSCLNGSPHHDVRRFWDRRALRQAVGTVDWASLQRVVRKLNAGQPILVVALGSSITNDFGGEWATRPGMVKAIVPRPVYRIPRLRLGGTSVNWASLVAGDGFLRMFMHMVNTTWPHPGHLVYNAGISGHSLLLSGAAHCLESTMPNVTVDLVLGEFIPNHDPTTDVFHSQRFNTFGGPMLESLIWRIAGYYRALQLPPPALVFLPTLTWDYNQQRFERCHPPHQNRCSQPHCATLPGPFAQPERDAPAELDAEGNLHGVLRYYRCSSLSVRYLLQAAMRDHLLLGNISVCEVARQLYAPIDPKHPGFMGVVLYADMLVHLLAEAAAMLHLAPAASYAGADDLRSPMPKRPLFEDGHTTWQMRCYGHSAADLGRQRQTAAAAATETAATASADEWVLSAIQWQHVILQPSGRPGGAPKYKPGWVASQVGSELRIVISTAFPRNNASRPASPVVVSLLFLRSYHHMGIARVACVANCVCTPARIDAYSAERVSVADVYDIDGVTQHERCIMEFKILPESNAPDGGHKFKLIKIIVRSLLAG